MTTPAERTEAMTEPTQAQIEEAKQLRAKFAFRGSLDVYTNELASIIAYIRREATNAALEKAAQLCHELMMSMRYGSPVFDGEDADDFDQGRAAGAEHCRNSIRALKDQP